jgi:hypothetical protein
MLGTSLVVNTPTWLIMSFKKKNVDIHAPKNNYGVMTHQNSLKKTKISSLKKAQFLGNFRKNIWENQNVPYFWENLKNPQ